MFNRAAIRDAHARLVESLNAAGLRARYVRKSKRMYGIRFDSSSVDVPRFWIRHDDCGWILYADRAVYRLPDSVDVARRCVIWTRGERFRSDLIRALQLVPRSIVDHSQEVRRCESLAWQRCGWSELTEAELDDVCDRAEALLRPLNRSGAPTTPSTAFDLASLLDLDLFEFDRVSDQLTSFALTSLLADSEGDTGIVAIDWNHFGYRLSRDAGPRSPDPYPWPVSAFPDGDIHVLASSDFASGILGTPSDATLRVFGMNADRFRDEFARLGVHAKEAE